MKEIHLVVRMDLNPGPLDHCLQDKKKDKNDKSASIIFKNTIVHKKVSIEMNCLINTEKSIT